VPDAQDLTQDFFAITIEGKLLSVASPNRGRFRSLLLKALQNFLRDKYEWQNAKKRCGGREHIPLHDWIAESPSRLSISNELMAWSPDKIFDFRWAVTLTERALGRLGQECETCGRQRMFSILSKYLMSDRSEASYPSLAASLGVTESAVKRLLHHLRGRYRAILREEVAQTVETPADIEDEVRYLCAVLAAGGT
jgi:RNA polymerase sigma-70 factor (ECF subfamily)